MSASLSVTYREGVMMGPDGKARGTGSRVTSEWIRESGDQWWVLHTRARNEKRLATDLQCHQMVHYLPLVPIRHTYAKAKATFDVPLFPGYVFLWGDVSNFDGAVRSRRVANVIKVTDQERFRRELSQICQVLESGDGVELHRSLEVGTRCRITRGPLRGVEGEVVENRDGCRLYLGVSMIAQSAVIEIDRMLLERLD